ncbi:MAG: hypothetical protein ACRERC_26830 [Candidatus Binatia bacterium]
MPERLQMILFSTDIDIDTGKTMSSRDDCLIGYSQSQVFDADLCFPSFAATDVDGAHTRGSLVLLSFDTATPLNSGEVAHPADVVIIGATDFIYFDHRQYGVPDSANVDAVTQIDDPGSGDDDLVLSFDATTVIDFMGTQLTVSDEDLVGYSGSGAPPEVLFDGSAHGVPEALDLDAADVLADGRLLVSFDAAGTVPGAAGPIAFEDEDVLLFTSGPDSWEMLWDASTFDAELARADLDAIASAELSGPIPTATSTSGQTPMSTPSATATATATVPGTAQSTPTVTATMPTATATVATTMLTATATATVAATMPTVTATVATPGPTATATGVVTVPTSTATADIAATPTRTAGIICVGDCNGNRAVAINELIFAVGVALGNNTIDQCLSVDANRNGIVAINELVQAVSNALSGCAPL